MPRRRKSGRWRTKTPLRSEYYHKNDGGYHGSMMLNHCRATMWNYFSIRIGTINGDHYRECSSYESSAGGRCPGDIGGVQVGRPCGQELWRGTAGIGELPVGAIYAGLLACPSGCVRMAPNRGSRGDACQTTNGVRTGGRWRHRRIGARRRRGRRRALAGV